MDLIRPLRPTLQVGLQAMLQWFQRMVHPSNRRIMYKYLPDRDVATVESSPIRDIGAARELAELQAHLGTRVFDPVIRATVRHYLPCLARERSWEGEGGGAPTAEGLGATETVAERGEGPLPRAAFGADLLDEPPTIAHSAMLLLALAADEWAVAVAEAEREELLAELANGILHQQRRRDGTYQVHFEAGAGAHSDSGWQLYSGEAMLALMAAYERLGEERYRRSVRRGLAAYERKWRAGEVDDRELVFFANWQTQAARRLLRHSPDPAAAAPVRRYVFALQDAVVGDLAFFDAVKRAPGRMATVEVACSLEGLADAFAVALECGEGERERQERYAQGIRTAVAFLDRMQVKPGQGLPAAAEGGFGHGEALHTQRVDVTGHVCSAYLKLLQLIDAAEA